MASGRPLIQESLVCLNLSGLNPTNQSKWSKYLPMFLFAAYFQIAFEMIYQMYFNWDILNSMDSVSGVSANFQILSKLTVLALKRNKFLQIFKSFDRFWPLEYCDSRLRLKIKPIYALSRKCLFLYYIIVGITTLLYYLKPLFGTTRSLPFSTYHPRDRYRNSYYYLEYFAQCVQVTSAALVMVGFDSLFVSLIININCELKMIKDGFSKISDICYDSEYALTEVKRLVLHHNLVLSCIKKMDSIYSTVLVNQFLNSIICVCAGLICFVIAGFPPDLQRFTKYSLHLVTFLSQLFFYCACGTYLTTESESISEAVYNSNWWVRAQPELRRAYILIIQRANKMEKLTAGGMMVLNLETFTNVVRTSLSFFTVVQAMFSRSDGN